MWANTDQIEFIFIIVAKILEVIHYKDYITTTFTVPTFITYIYDTHTHTHIHTRYLQRETVMRSLGFPQRYWWKLKSLGCHTVSTGKYLQSVTTDQSTRPNISDNSDFQNLSSQRVSFTTNLQHLIVVSVLGINLCCNVIWKIGSSWSVDFNIPILNYVNLCHYPHHYLLVFSSNVVSLPLQFIEYLKHRHLTVRSKAPLESET